MSTLVETRRSLHRVAELLLAGPQHAREGTIRLRVVPGGFTTLTGDVQVTDGCLVAGERRVELDGRSPAEVGAETGIAPRSLAEVYGDGPDRSLDTPLQVAAGAAARLGEALVVGDAALRRLVPEVEPVLWPEHFDVGVTLDEVNYGVSPGDGTIPEPYAYVGPWQVPAGAFWDRPFGAARLLADLGTADAVLAFFEEGRALRSGGRAAAER